MAAIFTLDTASETVNAMCTNCIIKLFHFDDIMKKLEAKCGRRRNRGSMGLTRCRVWEVLQGFKYRTVCHIIDHRLHDQA